MEEGIETRTFDVQAKLDQERLCQRIVAFNESHHTKEKLQRLLYRGVLADLAEILYKYSS